MWTIVKFDKKSYRLLKEELFSKLGSDCEIFRPQLVLQKFSKNKVKNYKIDLLGDYLFCYHKKFEDDNIFSQLKYLKGLKYFLMGFKSSQKEITNFIENCKIFSDEKGYVKNSFFNLYLEVNKKYKFLSGPFLSKIFQIISLKKKDIKILIGEINTTIKKDKFLFTPI